VRSQQNEISRGTCPMIVFVLLVAVFIFLAIGLVRTQVTARRLGELSWDDLLTKLEPVETDGITAVAVEYLNPSNLQIGSKPDDIWNMIGRAEGLSRMRANSDVLIALATYAQRWNLDGGLVVAERMRREGMALRRAGVGIGLGMTCGYGKQRVSSYVHEAASAYYLMRLRLFVLYETSHAGRYPSLAAAL
jgi:hypothetical protein